MGTGDQAVMIGVILLGLVFLMLVLLATTVDPIGSQFVFRNV